MLLNFCYILLNRYWAYCVLCVTVSTYPSMYFSLRLMLPWSLWAEYIFSVFLEIFVSDRKVSKSKYFQTFSGNYFCSCFMLHWSSWAENIFSVFRVRNYPSINDFGLEVSPLKYDLGRQASPLQFELTSGNSAFRGTYRDESGQNFLCQNFLNISWKQLFSTFHGTLITMSRKYFFRTKKILSPNFFKVFLETTFVHVSCYPDHYEPKIFFRFSKSTTTLRYTILDSRFPPWNAISEGRPPLCNSSSEAGTLPSEVSIGMSRAKNFYVKIF